VRTGRQLKVRAKTKVKKTESQVTTHFSEMDDVLFNEILQQVRMLMGFRGECGSYELRQQFRNLSSKTVGDFLLLAIKRGIIKEGPVGTFVLNHNV
jgi:hypothetical protein